MTIPTRVEPFDIALVEQHTGVLTAQAIARLNDTLNAILQQSTTYGVIASEFTTGRQIGQFTPLQMRDVSGRTKIAFAIKVPQQAELTELHVIVRKVNAPSGNVWFTIEAATTNDPTTAKPSGNVLATSQTISTAAMNASPTPTALAFTFKPAAIVGAGQLHFLVFQGDYTISATAYVFLYGLLSGTFWYPDGCYSSFDGANWASPTAPSDQNTPYFRAYHRRALR